MKIKLKRKHKKYIFVAGMLLIPVVHFIIFWGAVNFNSLFLSFKRYNVSTGQETLSWANFLQNLKNLNLDYRIGHLKTALINTFITSGFLTLLLPWGFFITYFLYKKIALSGFWRVMLFLPAIIPAIALTTLFKYMITPGLGPFAKILEAITGKTAPAFLQESDTAQWTVIAYIFWTNFGGSFILFSGAMSRIPKEILESSRIDGAGTGREMLQIILPLCWPTVSMLLLLNLASVFTASGPVLLLNRMERSTMTISLWIFARMYETAAPNYYEPAALGVLCTIVLLPVILVARRLLGKVYADVEF